MWKYFKYLVKCVKCTWMERGVVVYRPWPAWWLLPSTTAGWQHSIPLLACSTTPSTNSPPHWCRSSYSDLFSTIRYYLDGSLFRYHAKERAPPPVSDRISYFDSILFCHLQFESVHAVCNSVYTPVQDFLLHIVLNDHLDNFSVELINFVKNLLDSLNISKSPNR